MWMVTYMAQNRMMGEQIQTMLVKEGFLVKLKPVYKNVPSEENYYEVLVLKSEVKEVHSILMENGY